MKKLFFSSLLAMMAFFSTACSDDNNTVASKTFVLVHGAWQGAWVWQQVKSQLENKGQTVIVVELPAHGDDATPPLNTSIDIYRDKVVEAINKVDRKSVV